MRYLSIDILRGLAIVLMVQVHFVDNLSTRSADHAMMYDASARLGMIPAPLFTFLSGISYVLWLRKQEAAGRADSEITRTSLRRGLFLFAAGIAFNVFVWLPEDTFVWDILTLIGTSMLLLTFARKLPPAPLILMCVIVLVISPLLRAAADYTAYWQDEAYYYDFTLTDVSLGFLTNGYFPVLPWIVFPFAGFLVGEAIFGAERRTVWESRGILGLGMLLLAAGVAGGFWRDVFPTPVRKYFLPAFTMFPATTEYILATLGMSIISLVLLKHLLDGPSYSQRLAPLFTFFHRFSAYSLTVYILHHMAHLWPLWVYGMWTQDNPTYYWRQATSTPMALSLAFVFVIVCLLLLSFLERHGRIGFETLMRWLCD